MRENSEILRCMTAEEQAGNMKARLCRWVRKSVLITPLGTNTPLLLPTTPLSSPPIPPSPSPAARVVVGTFSIRWFSHCRDTPLNPKHTTYTSLFPGRDEGGLHTMTWSNSACSMVRRDMVVCVKNVNILVMSVPPLMSIPTPHTTSA